MVVVVEDQSWLKNEVIIREYSERYNDFMKSVHKINIFVYINDVIIIKLPYDSSKIAELVCLNENERKDLSV